jgi:hypothetical protein
MLDRDEAQTEKYADEQYRRFLKENDNYVDFDEYYRQKGIQFPLASSQNSCGHSSFSSEPISSEMAASKRFRIISSTSESLTLKTSARISLAIDRCGMVARIWEGGQSR